MTRESVLEKVTEIFRDVFDDSQITLEESTSAEDIEGWDSLMHINLIVTIEEELSIKFAMQEVIEMKSVSEIVSTILRKIK